MNTDYTANYTAIDAWLERELRRLRVPGAALAVVENGAIVHVRGFGEARPGGETPTAHTPFWIGSLTKSITALAVMQLVEAGEIDLDAPVQRYLPWFRVKDEQAGAQISVRHLLHQTSGLPGLAGEVQLADFDSRADAAERQGRALADVTLAHPGGAKFEYSNANYNLLGLVIEAAGGETYADYVQKHIFAPLDMRHTYTSAAEAQGHGPAVGHRYWFAAPRPQSKLRTPPGSLAAGALISCVEDMARYLIAHLDGGRCAGAQILSAAGIAELQRGAADFPMWGFGTRQYGMGWFVEQIGGQRLVWHSGTTPDFAAHMALLPDQGRGFVLLMNANHHMMVPVFIELGMGVTALLAGLEPGASPLHMGAWVPWLLAGLLLLPALPAAGIAWTLRRGLDGFREDPLPGRGSSRKRVFPEASFAATCALCAAFLLKPLLGRRRPYLLLYAADYVWAAQVCGGLALAGAALRIAPRRSGDNPTWSPISSRPARRVLTRPTIEPSRAGGARV